MRILYFTKGYTSHDFRFITSLSKTTHTIYFLSLGAEQRNLEQRMLPSNVHKVRWIGEHGYLRLFNRPKLWSALRQIVKVVQPDLIHAGPVQSVGFLSTLSRFRPLVIMSWGSDMLVDADRNIISQLITRYTLNQSSVFIGDCKTVREKAISYGVPNERIVTFPWGVNLDNFTPRRDNGLRERLKWSNSIVILSVRSWETIYGVDIVVRAFIKASRKIPSLRLILLGGGSQELLLRKIINDARMNERVYFGGRVSQEELPSFYQTADLYISASHSDGSSVSLMEALASGCPVIVSDIPGNKEWITSGKEGYLFSDGNVNDLKEKIIKIIQDQNKIKEMRHNARSLTEKRANWLKNFQQLLRAYEMATATSGHS